jgi:replicative DNA helicase
MTDKNILRQILGGLMQKPQLLSEVDKYSLTLTDFSERFERYVFMAIKQLYMNGAKTIQPIDISNCLDSNVTAKKVFELNHGVEYLQDAIDFSSADNFPYYYNELKKLNLIRDLKKDGFDTSIVYCEDLTNPKSEEINAKFAQLSLVDICNTIKMKFMKIESNYAKSAELEEETAATGIRDLIGNMNDNVEVGVPLQGRMYNKVVSGAQKQALTIRSGCSGLGKTRQAVGDACYLAYPIRYNSHMRQWEQTGSCEKVLFIMTEQTMKQVRKMILAYLSDINESRFKLGNFSAEEQKILDQAADIMEKYADNLILVKMPNPTIELVKTIVRENCLTKDIGYVFYDYVFIGPALLEQFRGFSLRNDEVLLMFTTALKDLAVELNVAMFTSTQVNANADDNKNIRNEASLAGGRSTINKADNGVIMARPSPEELETLEPITSTRGIPNCVTDVFKCRSGEWTQIRIWSQVDLGRLKKKDLFVTDARLEPIAEFFAEEGVDAYEVYEWDKQVYQEAKNFLEQLNGPKQEEVGKKVNLGLSEYY